MGRWGKPDLPEGPLRDLNEELHRLHSRAGHPSTYRISTWLSDRADQAEFAGEWPRLSRTSVHQVLTSPALPPWRLTMVVVEAFVSIGRLRDGVALIDRVEKLWNKAHAEDARRDDPATDSQERDPRSLVVLAVDDEPHGLDELVHGLRANPCVGEVLCAADAADALRLLATTNSPSPGQQAGSRPRVDAVFADIAMPGLSGIEMSRMIAAVNLVPSVVFVTAYADKAVDAFELGAVDYLLKPYRQSRLDDAIARVLGRQRARQEDR